MDRPRYDALVARLETFARERPTIYRVNVVVLSLVGYGYLVAILLLLLAGVALLGLLLAQGGGGGYFAIKGGIALVVLIGFVGRALWVRFEPPAGRPVQRAEAPQLFAELERLRASVGAPHFHAVLASTDFNACVAEVPRLGIFGFPRHYLVFGLPLMHALSPAQFRAVIAHELGHRSGRHGRIGAWVYRVRAAWGRLVGELEQRRQRAATLFTGFFRWYAPLFNAWSFVLAREQEYEADRLAASLTSPADIANALVALEVRGRFYEFDLWPGVVQLAATQADPPPAVFSAFAQSLPRGPEAQDAGAHLAAVLAHPTDTLNTHPALNDRLRALGVREIVPPAPLDETAADAMLGAFATRLAAEFDAQWSASAAPGWRDRHLQFAASRERLAAVTTAAEAAGAEEAPESLRERALLTLEIHGITVARPLILLAAEASPGDAVLRFLRGRLLVEARDARGVALVNSAMEQDRSLVLPGCDMLIGYWLAVGQPQAAEEYRKRAAQEQETQALAAAEREGVGQKDALEPHGLTPDAVRDIAVQFEREPWVHAAYMARKAVKYLPEQPYYVIGVDARFGFFATSKQKKLNELLGRLGQGLVTPGPAWIVVSERGNDALVRRMKQHRSAWMVFVRAK